MAAAKRMRRSSPEPLFTSGTTLFYAHDLSTTLSTGPYFSREEALVQLNKSTTGSRRGRVLERSLASAGVLTWPDAASAEPAPSDIGTLLLVAVPFDAQPSIEVGVWLRDRPRDADVIDGRIHHKETYSMQCIETGFKHIEPVIRDAARLLGTPTGQPVLVEEIQAVAPTHEKASVVIEEFYCQDNEGLAPRYRLVGGKSAQ